MNVSRTYRAAELSTQGFDQKQLKLFSNYSEWKIQQIEGDCEVSLRFSRQQPLG